MKFCLLSWHLSVSDILPFVGWHDKNHFLRVICDAAAKADCDLSICGDAAADAHLIPFLIGIGLRKFSMDPRMIPSVQSSIKEIEVSEAEDLARHVLKLGRITDVGAYLGIGNT